MAISVIVGATGGVQVLPSQQIATLEQSAALLKCVLHLRKNNFFKKKEQIIQEKNNEEFDKQKSCFTTSCQTLFVDFMQRQEQCNLWFSSETNLQSQKKICQMT